MDIRELESVCAVSACGSYTEAAFRLFISPATVSKHILRVEEELGVTLFERATKSRPVTLTPEGQRIIGELQGIVDGWRGVLDSVKAGARRQETLTIGYSPFIGTFGETELFCRFVAENPGVVLLHHTARSSELASLLSDGTLDGAMMGMLGEQPFNTHDLRALLSPEYRILLVAENRTLHIGFPEGHPLASCKLLTRELFPQLRGESFLFAASTSTSADSRSRRHIQELLGIDEDEMRCTFVAMTNREIALELVRSGRGILPQACMITEQPPGVRFVPVEGWDTPSRMYFICPARRVSDALRRFCCMVEDYVREQGK